MGIPDKIELKKAHNRISPFVHRTPILSSESINSICGCTIHFKCENFQKIGAFKFRGAVNTLFQLSEEELKNGVATHSSGNHGQAVALAAKMKGVPAYIVMPRNSTKIKIEAVKSYGAEVILCDNTLQSREDVLNDILNTKEAYFVHPYNDYRVIAGQSTSAQELIEDRPDIDFIVTPIGGGGLISGTALAAKYFSNWAKVVGVEPFGANSAFESVKKGELVTSIVPNTICDGLRAGIGEKNFEIISDLVEKIFCVDDNQAIAAMRLVWERMKIIIEPSCAVPLAGVLANKEFFQGKEIGIILTGGNVDLDSTSDLFKSII